MIPHLITADYYTIHTIHRYYILRYIPHCYAYMYGFSLSYMLYDSAIVPGTIIDLLLLLLTEKFLTLRLVVNTA